MHISLTEFENAARNIASQMVGHVGFDFETDGLDPRKGARAFIMGFTDTEGNRFCVRDMRPEIMRLFFSNPNLKYCAHHAKFEMSFLQHQFGIEKLPTIWDTMVMERLIRNDHMSYSLQNCAVRVGYSKYQPMLDWLKKRGNKNAYHKAPAELIEPYVEQDAWLSWELCRRQIETFRHWDKSPVPIREVVKLELRTLPHLFEMEGRGLLLDVGYCMRAREYEVGQVEKARAEFKQLTGVPFVASAKTLQPIFDRHGIPYGRTGMGNASFSEESIQGGQDHPIVRAIVAIRAAEKRVSSYWDKFLELEHNGLIHPSIDQNKAQTGRMSISEPSCQNWPTDEQGAAPEYPVRRAWIARPGCQIASLDYSQMELRKMVDEAADHGMIAAIKTGKDFHQETADMAGVPRSLAKNGRFAKLYGAGVPRVAQTLGISESLAATICQAIDQTAPETARYARELIKFAKVHGWGFNYLGRRYFFSDPKLAYLFSNYRIQGGCGEILRMAICEAGELIREHASPNTFMLIPIHDELLLNIHERDMHLLPVIKQTMIDVAKGKHLDMDVSVHVGPNFYDMEKRT